jgi:Ni2+-binding GTPase involved in maturation of urease and hydrogenase
MAKWKTYRTLLIVGEGYHEEAFLNHIKQFPRVCGQDQKITIKNAKGKGANHIVEWTIRQIANAAYDKVAVLLDTDTDWTPAVKKRAQSKKIQVLTSDTCLEEMLLRVICVTPRDHRMLKKQLAP